MGEGAIQGMISPLWAALTALLISAAALTVAYRARRGERAALSDLAIVRTSLEREFWYGRRTSLIRIDGSTSSCLICNRVWDTNDPEPPKCIQGIPHEFKR